MTYDPAKVREATTLLLSGLGEDPKRSGLVDTPDRVARAWEEMTAGYRQDPSKILSKRFEDEGYRSMIAVGPIDFYSTCEHHLISFHGVAFVGYIPSKGSVVGLSKLARLVDCFARRLQIQERMTHEIADAILTNLAPLGYGVVIKAQHLCMCARGVSKPHAEMITSELGGAFKEDMCTREEFLKLCL